MTLADLRTFGTAPWRIAARMNRVLADRELFSAHPTDVAALERIFEAAKIKPRFAHKSDAETVIRKLARLRGVTDRSLAPAKRKAELLSPLDVRPEAKARYLATLWAAIVGSL
jgi:hypothetical protein